MPESFDSRIPSAIATFFYGKIYFFLLWLHKAICWQFSYFVDYQTPFSADKWLYAILIICLTHLIPFSQQYSHFRNFRLRRRMDRALSQLNDRVSSYWEIVYICILLYKDVNKNLKSIEVWKVSLQWQWGLRLSRKTHKLRAIETTIALPREHLL